VERSILASAFWKGPGLHCVPVSNTAQELKKKKRLWAASTACKPPNGNRGFGPMRGGAVTASA
jgi:hypothetical protein